MSREVVTGYCWPQSVSAGGQVGLHMSSSGGRPVRVEVARVGGSREVVFRSDAVAADEHETPKDASSKGVAGPPPSRWTSSRRGGRATTRSSWRSTSARRSGATTPSSSCVRPRGAHRGRAGDQYVARLQRLWRPEPLQRRHPGGHAEADGGGLPLQAARARGVA